MMQMLTTITTGYAYFHPNSGIFGKFMPYHPAIRVSGRNIVVTTVKILMTLFCCTSISDWYNSRICTNYSRKSTT